ncbi:MAG: hypothetical protein WED09_05420 [Homoserinimonas sp.]
MNDANLAEAMDKLPARGHVPTAAELHALARIYTWNLRAWRPKTDQSPALVILDDPQLSSVNPRTATQLIDAGLLEDVGETLIITEAGAGALLERPELLLRMRASGAI